MTELEAKTLKQTNGFTVISLFAGAGKFILGFIRTGFQVGEGNV